MYLCHSIYVKPYMLFLCNASYHRLEQLKEEVKLEGKTYNDSTEKTGRKPSSFISRLHGDKQAPSNFTFPVPDKF